MKQRYVDDIKAWKGFGAFEPYDVNFICESEASFTQEKITTSILMEAVRRGEVDIVESLIQAGSNVNYISKNARTPLLSFDEETENKAEISKLLIEAGANVNFISNYKEEIDKTLNFLINNGLNINSSNGALLKSAISQNKNLLIRKLIDLGARADLSEEDDKYGGRTALMLFLDGSLNRLYEDDQEEVFYKLWGNVVDINTQDDEGKTLLFFATECDIGYNSFPVKIFDLILTHPDQDLNITDQRGDTALNYLLGEIDNELEDNDYEIYNDDLYMVKMLIIGKSNINLSNRYGYTPKIQIIEISDRQLAKLEDSDEEVIRRYLNGSSELVDLENELGYSPLSISVLNDNRQKAKWLFKMGASVDLKCKAYGRYETDILMQSIRPVIFTKIRNVTPLMLAQSTEMIKILLDNGAYVDSQDNRNNTPLMYFSSRQWFAGVRMLLDNGANPNIKNKDFDTALSFALRTRKKVKSDRTVELINLLKKDTKIKFTDRIFSLFKRLIRKAWSDSK